MPTVGALPELPKLPLQPKIVGTSTELYTRIAHGAVACWFGGSGPLRAKYLYHAEADSPSNGGHAEIVIHEKDLNAKQPRGVRAFRVVMIPAGETAELAVESYKLPEPLSKALTEDVYRWAAGEADCAKNNPASAWSAVAADNPPPEPAKKQTVASKRPGSRTKEKR